MQFDNFEALKQEVTEHLIESKIEEALNLEPVRIITNESIKDILSLEEARFLESEGFTITKFTQDNPFGCYALDDFKRARNLHRTTQYRLSQSSNVVYRIEKSFNSGFSIVSQPALELDQNQINNHGFYNIPTHTQIVSLYSPENQNQWSQPIAVPAGRHVTNSLNATNQYAQGCFEGMVAMVNSNGEVFTFRPFDNAQRLQSSARGLCIPEVSTENFMQAIQMAVVSNKSYLPSADSESKLYIRPHIKAITGGSGVAKADSYAFVVEVFPFGNYFANRETTLDLVAIQGTRRSTPGGVGHLKYIGNYARTMKHKELAKAGLVEGFEGQKFNDVFYMGDLKQTPLTQKLKINGEVLEEDAAGNLIFFRESNSGVEVFTPSLSRDTILPGFTRDSVLEICRSKGYNVHETHISFDMLKLVDGAMIVGSAAGAVRINSMSYNSETIFFSREKEHVNIFYDIFDTLYNLRRGILGEFENHEIISKYPFKIDIN